MTTKLERKNSLLPDGKPRYIRCYDDGKSGDRYTVVFTGHYTYKTAGEHWVRAMSGSPFHPQGIGILETYPYQIDYPSYKHLGRKIKFENLPEDCQKLVLSDYVYLWDIKDHPYYTED